MKQSKRLQILPVVISLLYLMLYIPIAILVVFSFNEDPYVFYWQGFTTKWYAAFFESSEVWDALKNSIIVAFSSAWLSLLMGGFFVCYANSRVVRRLQPMFYGILAMPEIVLAVSLLSFFSFLSVSLGFTTLIVGHSLLGLGYVVPIVHGRFMELDRNLIEAAYDLGASRGQVIRTVIVPLLRPALFAGALLTFIISFDDFIFSFFCAGGTAQTLPMYIFAMMKVGASPTIAVLSTVLLCMSTLFAMSFFWLRFKQDKVIWDD